LFFSGEAEGQEYFVLSMASASSSQSNLLFLFDHPRDDARSNGCDELSAETACTMTPIASAASGFSVN